MSSLPFISHHLYAAAAGQDDRGRRRATRQDPAFRSPDDSRGAAGAELIEPYDPSPTAGADTLRLAVLMGET